MQTDGSLNDYAKYATSSTALRLRPLSSAEILDYSQFLFRAHGFGILKRTLLPTLYIFAAATFLSTFIIRRSLETQYVSNTNAQVIEFFVVLLIGFFVSVPLVAAGVASICITTSTITKQWFMEGKLDWDAVDLAIQVHFWPAVKTLIRTTLSVFKWVFFSIFFILILVLALSLKSGNETAISVVGLVGFLLLIGTLFLAVLELSKVLLSVPISIFESCPAKQAISRSRFLTAPIGYRDTSMPIGSGVSVILFANLVLYSGYGLVVGALDIGDRLISMTSSPILLAVVQTAISLLPAFLAFWTTVPYLLLIVSVSYFDRRVRKEAYDLEILAQELPKLS